jgi:hypothetical protein
MHGGTFVPLTIPSTTHLCTIKDKKYIPSRTLLDVLTYSMRDRSSIIPGSHEAIFEFFVMLSDLFKLSILDDD